LLPLRSVLCASLWSVWSLDGAEECCIRKRNRWNL